METLGTVALGVIGTVLKLVENAKNASAQEHEFILARLEEADENLKQAMHDAKEVIAEETKKTQDAVDAVLNERLKADDEG